jgi:hypothetical protein
MSNARRRVRPITVGLLGTWAAYRDGFLHRLLAHVSPRPIKPVRSVHCDLLIVGPFDGRTTRRVWDRFEKKGAFDRVIGPRRPCVLMHLEENIRPGFFPSDYVISSDFCPPSEQQIRFPYWMEMLDWSADGFDLGTTNIRHGRLLSIDRLMQPLGTAFLGKPFKAAMFVSHLRAPRRQLVDAVRQVMPVDGFGPGFDPTIRDHDSSGFAKSDVLAGYGFNLCPENSLFPGYYTEKIPEAFDADCLPITWAEPSVRFDFNPRAFVNLCTEAVLDDHGLPRLPDLTPERLRMHAAEPLLLERPSLGPLITFLERILASL